jgi:hypothetical protein
MRGLQHWKFRMLALVLAPAILVASGAAQVSVPSVHFRPAGSAGGKVIIIGFVGGFVSQDDTKHFEVQFAVYLRDRYPLIEAVVFGNHHGRKALHEVVRMLDTDGDGVLTPNEKRESTIIIYGHSHHLLDRLCLDILGAASRDKSLRAISEQLGANSDHKLTSDREATPPLGEKWLKSSKHKAYVRTQSLANLESLVNIE